jgi:membrane associated rhomboid family serine protease
MIPLKDENPKKNLPFINFIFILVNIAVFIYQPSSDQLLKAFYNTYGLIPNSITNISPANFPNFLATLQSLFTSLFVHGGFMHLAGNMLFLWVFGDNIEYAIGHINYFFFYILCGIAAAFTQVFIEPGSLIPLIGASGAISGILGAYIIKFPKNKVTTLFIIIIFIKIIKIRAVYLLGIWFLFQIFQGYFSLGQESMGGVAWFAHIGGFISGMILVNIFKKRPNR